MSESPNPFDGQRLKRASIVGVVLAVGAVALFLVLWTLLGNSGLDQFPRLIISLCVPPAVLALLVGAYFLITQSRRQR
jgi:lipopolysaccharide export LptBFGC system permease protein LptF